MAYSAQEMDRVQMIQSLRKQHRYIWFLWGLIIPLGFILVLFNIPNPQPGSLILKPEIVPAAWTTVVESGKISILKTKSDQGKADIKIELREPWRSPFVTIYENDIEGPNLGRIEGIGDYYFKTQGNPRQLVFYDEIKATVLLTVELR